VPISRPPEFRRKVLDLLKVGRTVAQLVNDLQVSDQTIYSWRRQEAIDTGRLPGVTSTDHAELTAARRRIAELETELEIRRSKRRSPASPDVKGKTKTFSYAAVTVTGWPRCSARSTAWIAAALPAMSRRLVSHAARVARRPGPGHSAIGR
jgi:transposase-like protein